MHHDVQKSQPSTKSATPKPKSAAEQQLAETIAREAREDRCYRCFHSPCGCPPGFGLRRPREEVVAEFTVRLKP